MILVTGATGLLGSHIVVELAARGELVKAMFRDEKRQRNVIRLMDMYFPNRSSELLEKITWFKGDVCDLDDVAESMIGTTKIIHCAALVSFHRRDFNQLFEINRQGTANLVNFALEANISQFIHVSSTAAIGSDSEHGDGIRRETNGWNANEKVSGYSLSKHSAEKEVWRGKEEGLTISIVNPSILFGPGNWNESSLTIFRTLNNGLKFYTEGSNAFVDVRDVTAVVLQLLDSELLNERFLVSGTNLSYKALFDLICKELNTKPPKYLAGPFLTTLAWRISRFLSRFTGKQPTITKESARSSQRKSVYSSDKLLTTFPDFKFRTIEETIQFAVKNRFQD